MKDIKNIIFDVGNVLVAWDPEKVFKDFGLNDDQMKLIDERIFDSGVWDKNDEGKLGFNELIGLFREKAIDSELADAIEYFYRNVDKAIEKFDYTDAFITELKNNGYNIYVLSNYGEYTYQRTLETGLSFLPLVDKAFFSYEHKMLKPNDDIYQAMLEEFDLDGAECVFLDDRQANIDGAERNGIHGILFTGLDEAKEKLRGYGVRI